MSIIPPFSLPESGFYPATQDAPANAVLVLVADRQGFEPARVSLLSCFAEM